MTNESATRLLNKFSEPYLYPYSKKLPELDARRWIRFFMGWEVTEKEGLQILTAYVGLNPPRTKSDGSPAGSMPELRAVEEFYNNSQRPRTQNIHSCPCCNNSRWVLVQKKITNLDTGASEIVEYLTVCDCIDRIEAEDCLKRPIRDGVNGNPLFLKAYNWFREHPRSKCTSMQCTPTESAPCPRGMPHYNQMKIKFRQIIEQDPAYKRGLAFSKYHKDSVEETTKELAEKMPEIPGYNEDNLPF